LVVRQQGGVREQRLAEPGDIAVAEDAEAPVDEPCPHAVALDVLGAQEADERLGGRQPDSGHAATLRSRAPCRSWYCTPTPPTPTAASCASRRNRRAGATSASRFSATRPWSGAPTTGRPASSSSRAGRPSPRRSASGRSAGGRACSTGRRLRSTPRRAPTG